MKMAQLAVGVNQILGVYPDSSPRGIGLLGNLKCAAEACGPTAGGFKTREKRLPVRVYRASVRLILLV